MFSVVNSQSLRNIVGSLIQWLIPGEIGIGGSHDRVEDLISVAADPVHLVKQRQEECLSKLIVSSVDTSG